VSRRRPSLYHGLLPISKVAGPTSHDVVDLARKALGERRIGHTGTLDPLAEGLLLLCVGQATRLQQFLLQWNKRYEGEIRLGHATTTYDSEGEATEPRGEPPALETDLLQRVATQFSGEIQQIPPPYSAKKVAGKKLYELARSGQTVPLEPKAVHVDELSLTAKAADLVVVRATTSTGFYVRSLAHDIGVELGCGGYLERLNRTGIGPYTLESALSQDDLASATDAEEIVGGRAWIPLDRVALPFPEVSVNSAGAARFVHGQDVVVFSPGIEGVTNGDSIVVKNSSGHMLGIGTIGAVLARGRTLNIAPSVVFATATQGGA
jgi:tRNA pseudouridine55 synthase